MLFTVVSIAAKPEEFIMINFWRYSRILNIELFKYIVEFLNAAKKHHFEIYNSGILCITWKVLKLLKVDLKKSS